MQERTGPFFILSKYTGYRFNMCNKKYEHLEDILEICFPFIVVIFYTVLTLVYPLIWCLKKYKN